MAIFKLACIQDPQVKLSVSPDTPSEIVTGEHAGQLLSSYLKSAHWQVLGERALNYSGFPFKISWITPEKAVLFSPFTEKFWMILNDTRQGRIYVGAKNPVPLDWENNDEIIQDLHEVKPFYQEVFALEPGTLAAVGQGVSVLNVEQESNLDSEAVQLEGQPFDDRIRTLHLDDGSASAYELFASDSFYIYKTRVDGKVDFETDRASFGTLVMIEGSGLVEHDGTTLHVNTGDTVFVEADTHDIFVTGNCTFIFVKL